MLNKMVYILGQPRPGFLRDSGKKISLALGILLIIGLVMNSGSLFAFAGGDGSEGDPYQVATATHLNDVRNYLSSYFIQTADINLNVSPYNTGDGWVPIGNSTVEFEGTYNGNGKTIDNLFINRSSTDYIGLFGVTYVFAKIENLGVTNVSITGNDHVGGLVGYNQILSTIENCYTTGIVSGNENIGGLVGNNKGKIYTSYSSVTVSGTNNVGGLSGVNLDFLSDIANCYATGSVGGTDAVGGLVGSHNAGDVTNSYSNGAVTFSSSGGGLIGFNGGTVTLSFWDTQTSGQGSSAGGEGKLTSEMKDPDTFFGWSPVIWYMDAGFNNGYAYLSWQNPGGTPLPVELSSFTASCLNGIVTLNWTTECEINNSGFDIERKRTENANWMKIGFVEGHGTVNTPQSYVYKDKNLTAGKYGYRLKQIDHNGNYEYFDLSSDVLVGAPSKFNVSQNYPNPFNPKTNISFELPCDSKVSIVIFDMLGREVTTLVDGFKEAGYHTVEFDGSNLSSGMYFYRIHTENFEAVKRMLLIK